MSKRIVVITGGAQGIGRAVAMAFLELGDTVVIADADEEANIDAHETLLANENRAVIVPTDVSQETDVALLMAYVEQTYGRIDVLVNNAGTFQHGRIDEVTMAMWDHVMNVNLRAPFMMVKYGIALLQKSKQAVVINMASTRALMSEPNTFAYSASKGGIAALTHALAVSLGPNVRVNAISPGWIEVGDWKKPSTKTTPYHRPEDMAQHPAGRVGRPEDIASMCVYLASAKASFITGQNIVIDGGMTVKMIYEPDEE